jgi:hypothetical protein
MLELLRLPGALALVALLVLALRTVPVLLRELSRRAAVRQALRGRNKAERDRAYRVLELIERREPPDG